MVSRIARGIYRKTHPFWPFLQEDALAINAARLDHLATLDLPVAGKSVLEVGAGIGLLTPFFIQRGCRVVSTDSRAGNVAEIKRRHPALEAEVVDLDHPETVKRVGPFDIVFCYGTLYHLAKPDEALAALAEISQLILLETVVNTADDESVQLVEESTTINQAAHMVGARPSRQWVLNRLRSYWGHGYISRTQPAHPDFPVDWKQPPTGRLTRAIFVGSRAPISNRLLAEEIPSVHEMPAGV